MCRCQQFVITELSKILRVNRGEGDNRGNIIHLHSVHLMGAQHPMGDPNRTAYQLSTTKWCSTQQNSHNILSVALTGNYLLETTIVVE